MSGEPTGAISDGVVEAAAKALHDWIGCPPGWDELDEHARSILRGGAIRILAAALPHIRSAIADEIEAAKVPLHDPNIEIQRLNAVIRAAYDGAARVARGGPTE